MNKALTALILILAVGIISFLLFVNSNNRSQLLRQDLTKKPADVERNYVKKEVAVQPRQGFWDDWWDSKSMFPSFETTETVLSQSPPYFEPDSTESEMAQATTDLEALINLCAQYKDSNEIDDLFELYEPVINNDYQNIEIYKSLSDFLIQESRVDEALSLLYKGIELNPEDPQFRYLLGDTLTMLQQYQEALEQYQVAIMTDKANPAAYYNFAQIYEYMDLYDIANQNYMIAQSLWNSQDIQ